MSASTCSPSSWRSSPAPGATPAGQGTRSRRALHVRRQPRLPKPLQHPHPPVIVGRQRAATHAGLAARFADRVQRAVRRPSTSSPTGSPGPTSACRAIGRDPATLARSAAQVLCVGRDDAEVAAGRTRSAASPTSCAPEASRAPRPRSSTRSGGSPSGGLERFYLQVLDLSDLDHLELVAARWRRSWRDGSGGPGAAPAASPRRRRRRRGPRRATCAR